MTFPLSSAPPRAGLFVARRTDPIPLERVAVKAEVVDLAATVSITQRYRNQEATPLEVVYVFPLDEGAAVCGFTATVDGVRFAGEVKEREAAFRDYDDAMEAGHGGYLLDEERADVFTASLGNVRPGSEVELTITYVTELGAEGAAARFALPTTVSPRYAPTQDTIGVGRTPAETLNPPIAADVPYRFTFDMTVSMSGDITRIESPSHPISVDRQGACAKVALTQRDAAMDRDLVVIVAAEGLERPHATVERDDRGDAVMLSFVPGFETVSAPAEVVFLVDRSGSMGGDSIAEVRNALELCLRSLATGCRFNIVGFGSTVAALFPESRAYDDTSLREASAHVAGLDADLGGTEILPALEFVLGAPGIEGLSRQVVVLTDGEVTNTDEVIATVRRHASHARVFTFGIGAGASHHLVKGIARASKGAAEFIAPGERIEAKVLRQFRRVLSPAITDVRVAWPSAAIVQAPKVAPAVFPDDRFIVYALADQAVSGTVTVSGRRDGREFREEVAIGTAQSGRSTIGTLAARARIRDLEEQPEYLESRGSLQGRVRGSTGVAAEIIALGVRYQICSRETSFVAIEHRDTPVTEPAELRRVPVALTSGWGGTGDRRGLPGALRAGGFGAVHGGTVVMGAPVMSARSAGALRMPAGFGFRDMGSPDVASCMSAPAAPPLRPHDELIRLQRADGSWELDRSLARVVGCRLRTLEDEAARLPGDPAIVRAALATALALAWLERHAAASNDEWGMLAEKAARWLDGHAIMPQGPASWREWLEVARRLL